jgi:hypothetical protein
MVQRFRALTYEILFFFSQGAAFTMKSPDTTPSSCREHILQRTHSIENTSAPSAGSAGIVGAGASDGSGGRKKCAELGARATAACVLGTKHDEEEARAGLNGLNGLSGLNGLNGYRESMDISVCSSGDSSARELPGGAGGAGAETQIEKSSQEPSKMKEGVHVAVGWQGLGAQGVGGQGARRFYGDASVLKAKTCSQAQSGADLCRQSKGKRDVLAVLREKTTNVDISPSASHTRPMARVSSLGQNGSGEGKAEYEDDKTLDTLRKAPSSRREHILERTHSRENKSAPSAWPANNEDDESWDTLEGAVRGRVREDDKTWDTLRNWAPPTPYVNKEKDSYKNQQPGKRYNHQNVEEGGSLDGLEDGFRELGCRDRVRRTEVWPEMCGAIESSFLRAQTVMASAGLLPR